MNKSPKIVESENKDTPIKLPLLKDLDARIPKMTMKTFSGMLDLELSLFETIFDENFTKIVETLKMKINP